MLSRLSSHHGLLSPAADSCLTILCRACVAGTIAGTNFVGNPICLVIAPPRRDHCASTSVQRASIGLLVHQSHSSARVSLVY